MSFGRAKLVPSPKLKGQPVVHVSLGRLTPFDSSAALVNLEPVWWRSSSAGSSSTRAGGDAPNSDVRKSASARLEEPEPFLCTETEPRFAAPAPAEEPADAEPCQTHP